MGQARAVFKMVIKGPYLQDAGRGFSYAVSPLNVVPDLCVGHW